MTSLDFVNTLARAVSQGMAGVQQQATQAPTLGQQMMPMMMMPHGTNMFYPASQQGGQRQ